MVRPVSEMLPPLSAGDCGRICAVAGQSQRDLQECAARYADLFPANPFDPALFSTIALANAFCAPWLGADELRIANRATLWAFGLDWLIDYLAKSPEEVHDVVRRCELVADGGTPAAGDPIGRFLAEIHAELAAAAAFPALYEVWRQEFQRMLDAMVREWGWQSRRTTDPHAALPSFEEYLANADNICFSFVYVSHWVTTSGPPPVRHIEELLAAGRATQRVIRLLNDIGTYDRDRTWGDLNVMMLGVSAEDLDRHIAALAAQCEEQLRRLHADSPQLAVFLARYIRFNSGFYRTTDYWGTL